MDTPPRYGPWIVEKEMGEGTFAQVFRAFHADDSTRRVALKVLREEWRTRRMFRERFADEAHTMDLLGSGASRLAGLAAYYGADTDGPIPWIAIEYIDGRPLDDVLADGRLPNGELVPRTPLERAAFASRVLRDVTEALAFAHRRGIVHRDVKPENVLCGKDGRIVIIDFGIARDARAKRHTGEDVPSPMTPDYAAPELLESRVSEHLEPALDIYALGCMLFEVITGRLPDIARTTTDGGNVRYLPRPGPLALPEPAPDHLRILVRAMTDPDAMARPSVAQVISTLDTGSVPPSLAPATLPPDAHQTGSFGAMSGGHPPTPPGYPGAPPGFPSQYGTGHHRAYGAQAAYPQQGYPQTGGYPTQGAPPPGTYPSAEGAIAPQQARAPGYYPMRRPSDPPTAPSHTGSQRTPALSNPPVEPTARPVARSAPKPGTALPGATTQGVPPLVWALAGLAVLIGGGSVGFALLSSQGDVAADFAAALPDAPAADLADAVADAPPPAVEAEPVETPAPAPNGMLVLEVTTSPTGAALKINGQAVGRTPTQVRVPAGPHQLEFNHPSLRTIHEFVDAADGRVDIDLAARARASQLLVLESRYLGATIRVDGRRAGRVPAVIDVIPGPHVVEVQNAGGAPVRRDVVARAEATVRVDFD